MPDDPEGDHLIEVMAQPDELETAASPNSQGAPSGIAIANGAQVGLDGWISALTEEGLSVHVRTEAGSDGHLIVTGVLIEGAEIDTDALRSVHPARLLAAVSESEVPGKDSAGQLIPVMSGASLLRRAARGDSLDHDDSKLSLGTLRARAVSQIIPRPRPLLGRPTSNRAEFYVRLADAYRSAASESGRPAKLIAAENHVPVETVRRWVKEARRLGLLAPGRLGRAL